MNKIEHREGASVWRYEWIVQPTQAITGAKVNILYVLVTNFDEKATKLRQHATMAIVGNLKDITQNHAYAATMGTSLSYRMADAIFGEEVLVAAWAYVDASEDFFPLWWAQRPRGRYER